MLNACGTPVNTGVPLARCLYFLFAGLQSLHPSILCAITFQYMAYHVMLRLVCVLTAKMIYLCFAHVHAFEFSLYTLGPDLRCSYLLNLSI